MAKVMTDPICTIETCPWNGQPMSAHPKRDRSHVPEYISFAAEQADIINRTGPWRTADGEHGE